MFLTHKIAKSLFMKIVPFYLLRMYSKDTMEQYSLMGKRDVGRLLRWVAHSLKTKKELYQEALNK